nr:response regulator transcription factor [uncultured Cellulosilyticum sp.]
MRVLLAEDEQDLNNIIVKKLKSEGYTVDACFDGEEALDFIEMAEYDVIILDIMMPKMDGLELVREMRRRENPTPVIFLTARDAIEDRVKGLDMGANDYLVKPFSFDELMARIRVLTRSSSVGQTSVYTIADLSVDVASHIVKRGEDVITLSAKEFALLEYLIRNKGKVLSREKIENNLWNYEYEGGTNAVDVYIRYLRKKLDDNYTNKLIHTVRGCGYVLREDI